MATTYAHHFLSRGCELAGCDAPDRRCDLYLVEGERRAVRACCGAHARAAQGRCWWCNGAATATEPLHAIPSAYDAAGRPVMPMLAVHAHCERQERGE